jgi:hypothetical protein
MPPLTAIGNLKTTDDALTQARTRNPDWGIWISNSGRYWATRRGNILLTEDAHPDWDMTVDADSLEELERQIKVQNGYDKPPVPRLYDLAESACGAVPGTLDKEGDAVEKGAKAQQGLYRFERTYLERLKLACEVLLELAGEDQLTDPLEVELRSFKEQVEHKLLQPDRPEATTAR